MPDKPLLILPIPALADKAHKGGGPGNFHAPSPARQHQRLGPKFEILQNAFDSQRATLRADAAGLPPEQVLVLELVGTVEDFVGALNRVGMEWLGEIDEGDLPPDDDFFEATEDGSRRADKKLRGRLFLALTNQAALTELKRLWGLWQEGSELPWGKTKWASIFSHLKDLRPWGVEDRLLETGALDDWHFRIEHAAEFLPCEVELWYRKTDQYRERAKEQVSSLVVEKGGTIVGEAVIPDIGYHTLLVRLPAAAINEIFEAVGHLTALVQCESIQYFRAAGQMASGLPPAALPPTEQIDIPRSNGDLGVPVVALLDGLPLQQHEALGDRITVDDPDEIEELYPAEDRRHGTAMASLILHGDLGADAEKLQRKLYVRPILRPDPKSLYNPRDEVVPDDKLVVDVIHRAVRRICEGDGDEPAVAPEVCVINISIGIRDRLFDGALTPLARLLDWLAWKYKILFVVSAGNHLHPVELSITGEALRSLPPDELQKIVMQTIADDARNRRLLSPADSINALTVGSVHTDQSNGGTPPYKINPYQNDRFPSPFNAQGMGFRRAIKPDVMAAGGQLLFNEPLTQLGAAKLEPYLGILPPGQKVAAPGGRGRVTNTIYTRGTSNSAALISRSAAILYEVLDELSDEQGGDVISTVPRAVWLKTLIAHSADWGVAESDLAGILKTPENSRQFREYLSRLIGYGEVDVGRVKECLTHRVTALGGGLLSNGTAHLHQFPLPPSLSSVRGLRRLTLTLGWLTPVNPGHQKWRRADLWLSPTHEKIGVSRCQANDKAAKRGTLQHEVFKGDQAVPFIDGATLEIKVTCRSEAGALNEEIPYSLALTLEVAPELNIPIYEEVRTRVQARVRAQVENVRV